MLPTAPAIDLHQHLWPAELVDRLRARHRAPYLRGWTLVVEGEPAYDVRPADHDVASRVAADRAAGVGTACVGLSSPLGIENLPPSQAAPLLEAWHDGLLGLPDHFLGWVSLTNREPDGLDDLLVRPRTAGLQLPATVLATPSAWERAAPLLEVARVRDKPVLVHPGPARGPVGRVPAWWAPSVDYVAQMHAAWWAWRASDVRSGLPGLRLVFAAAAGLAPLHHERQALRGGADEPIDPLVFVDSAGYGPQALDALVRVLGIDALVLGSDRPYGAPVAGLFGDAASHAVRVTNPARALGPAAVQERSAGRWACAS